MRLTPDEPFGKMSTKDLKEMFCNYTGKENNEARSREEMIQAVSLHQRTRSIQLWHDGSSIIIHSYMLFMVSFMYDTAVYITESELPAGDNTDLQATIEKPHLYIIARCRGNEEQLAFASTRIECLRELKDPLTINGIQINDKMRTFHGDNPAVATECGNQKNGHYFCNADSMHAASTTRLHLAYRLPPLSLQERTSSILQGAVCRTMTLNKEVYPLKGLKKKELDRELTSRGIYAKDKAKRQDLQEELTEVMAGQQRVPAILFDEPLQDLANICCQDYEMLPIEPMHDLAGHLGNIYTSLPHHIDNKQKDSLTSLIKLCIGPKDTPRCADMRASVLKLIPSAADYGVEDVLNSFAELQQLLYARESRRTPNAILRCYLIAFKHARNCLDLFGKKPKGKEMTPRKFYGKYFHSLSIHAAQTMRVFNGKTVHAERQESCFGDLKGKPKMVGNIQGGG